MQTYNCITEIFAKAFESVAVLIQIQIVFPDFPQ